MSPAARRAANAETAPEQPAEENRASWIGLHSLRPAPGSRRPRKRVGRGEGSGGHEQADAEPVVPVAAGSSPEQAAEIAEAKADAEA